MARHSSGVFFRNDRITAPPGSVVRLYSLDRKHNVGAQLLALGAADLTLCAPRPSGLALGCKAQVAVTLPGRYIEMELPCIIDWEDGPNFGIRLDYLSARQAYGFSLLRDLFKTAAAVAAPATRRSAAK